MHGRLLLRTVVILLCSVAPAASMARENIVTLETRLDEMVDRDGMARFPAPER